MVGPDVYYADTTGLVTLYAGDVLDVLRRLPSGSVQCCVTSPPYYALRSYLPTDDANKGLELGSEATPDAYIANMVAVFAEVRRVLRGDGTLWLNIGDSYNSGTQFNAHTGLDEAKRYREGATNQWNGHRQMIAGIKPKDLMLIPERLALALQADGWWVRSRIAWAKRAPMPESVSDRPTSAWEHIWLLSKSATYYYDAEAVREPASKAIWESISGRARLASPTDKRDGTRFGGETHPEAGRNQRNFWLLSPEPFPAAHFATFVSEVPRRAILAGTSQKGACPTCGKAWRRVTERGELKKTGTSGNTHTTQTEHYRQGAEANGRSYHFHKNGAVSGFSYENKTTGWAPSCACPPAEPVPCVVLDPFVGSGTTAMVARQLVRRAIGIDLSREYLQLAIGRVQSVEPGVQLALGVEA